MSNYTEILKIKEAPYFYEVISDYPFNKHFIVGQIINIHLLQNGEGYYHFNKGYIHQSFEVSFFDTYPSIFKKTIKP